MRFTMFEGERLIASGSLAEIVTGAQALAARGGTLRVFDDATGRLVDLDLTGTPAEIVSRYENRPKVPAKRGRPRLGVAAREVTLLPRHWDWLGKQRGGASAHLRRLVDAAMRSAGESPDRGARNEAAYRVATVLASGLPGYDEAMRALFAGRRTAFQAATQDWPKDVAAYVLALTELPPA